VVRWRRTSSTADAQRAGRGGISETIACGSPRDAGLRLKDAPRRRRPPPEGLALFPTWFRGARPGGWPRRVTSRRSTIQNEVLSSARPRLANAPDHARIANPRAGGASVRSLEPVIPHHGGDPHGAIVSEMPRGRRRWAIACCSCGATAHHRFSSRQNDKEGFSLPGQALEALDRDEAVNHFELMGRQAARRCRRYSCAVRRRFDLENHRIQSIFPF